MMVRTVLYHPTFVKELRSLPAGLQQAAIRAEKLFRQDPFHPSLRIHRLRGELSDSWSISITRKARIIFKRASDGDVLFYSIGFHDIYRSL